MTKWMEDLSEGPGDGKGFNPCRTCSFQGLRAFVEGGSGGMHVVNQENAPAGDFFLLGNSKGPFQVGAPCAAVEFCLGWSGTVSFEQIDLDGFAPAGQADAAKEQCLVETTLTQALEVERNRNNNIGAAEHLLGSGLASQGTKGCQAALPAPEFQVHEQGADRFLVEKERTGPVKGKMAIEAVAAEMVYARGKGDAAAGAERSGDGS